MRRQTKRMIVNSSVSLVVAAVLAVLALNHPMIYNLKQIDIFVIASIILAALQWLLSST
jgi:hypothetical protein